ncbi:hypothetical protein LJC33_05660 [Eubacteriales bacterium OttesenSCG-928-N13]|nr:hypothetical protein [Eubacteriales bacterium OttesenSCG-928-N13]
MKRKLWITGLLMLLLVFVMAAGAMAEVSVQPSAQRDASGRQGFQSKGTGVQVAPKDMLNIQLNSPSYTYGSVNPGVSDVLYQFTITERSKVTLKMKQSKSQRGPMLYLIDDASTPDYFLVKAGYNGKWPRTYTLVAYLDPGTYYLDVYNYTNTYRTFSVHAKAEPLSAAYAASGAEHDLPAGYNYTLGNRVKGMIGAKAESADYFKFNLPQDSKVSIEYKLIQCRQNFYIVDMEGEIVYQRLLQNGKYYSKSKTYKMDVNLPEGDYYIVVGKLPENDWGVNGLYELKLKYKSVASTKLVLSSNYVTAGFSKDITAGVSPVYFPQGSFVFDPVDNKYATLTADGQLTGKAPGSFYARAYVTAGDYYKTAKLKITVKKNQYVRSKPYKGSKGYITMSIKKMYYKGDKVYVELFLYNNVNKKFTMARMNSSTSGSVVFALADQNDVFRGYADFGNSYKLPKKIGYKKYGVLKMSITPTNGVLIDLAGGDSYVTWLAAPTFSNKGITMKSTMSKSGAVDQDAMPAEGYEE